MKPGSRSLEILLCACAASAGGGGGAYSGLVEAFSPSLTTASTTSLFMAKTKNAKKKKKTSASSSGLTGFGGGGSGGSSSDSAEDAGTTGKIDRSKDALAFYDYVRRSGGESNLKRVGLGQFPLPGSDGATLRGVVALRDIAKGEALLEVPYEMALDLGRESADPTLPGTTLLQMYCLWKQGDSKVRAKSEYFTMLPPFMSADSLGSTDFFSDVALDALQSPMVKEETLSRRELVGARYERDVEPMAQIAANLYRWGDDGIATEEHLRWAVWLVTSRVLTVQGAEGTSANRLMIPFIDMCNHDRDSPHVLTGRAVPGAALKVLAGRDVKAGEPINICYGGGVEGNDRFVQDYGFLDAGGSVESAEGVVEAYKITAQKLLGRSARGTKINIAEQERALEALRATTLEEDEALLDGGSVAKDDERIALEYRIGMKRALKELSA